jgi:hypothetical protein
MPELIVQPFARTDMNWFLRGKSIFLYHLEQVGARIVGIVQHHGRIKVNQYPRCRVARVTYKETPGMSKVFLINKKANPRRCRGLA